MRVKQLLFLGTSVLVSCLFWTGRHASAEPQGRIVRIAELEIDPTQLESYKAALKEEIETSIRVEPGVLTLYAVAIKNHPAQIRIFETYADEAAYRAHLETPHFKKYKTRTQEMVKSLKLIDGTDPARHKGAVKLCGARTLCMLVDVKLWGTGVLASRLGK